MIKNTPLSNSLTNTYKLPKIKQLGYSCFPGKQLSKDTFQKSNISFKHSEGISEETKKYIKETQDNLYGYLNYPNSLKVFDPEKMMDICKGIKVFKDWDAKDLMINTNNFEGILLQRGCSHACSHCCFCASEKISTIKWENFTDLIDGMAELKNRLGFNPFNNHKNHDNYGDPVLNTLQPFIDSDPMLFRSTDKDGKTHDIFDAASLLYNKTGTKFTLSTSGWDKNNAVSQHAAEQLVKHPEVFEDLQISITPFHYYIEKSYECRIKGEMEKSQYWFDKYLDMMANVIQTFLPLLDIDNKLKIKLEYLGMEEKRYDLKAITMLETAILARVNKTDKQTSTIYQNFFPMPISKYGRAKMFNEDNYPIYDQYRRELISYLFKNKDKSEKDFLKEIEKTQPKLYREYSRIIQSFGKPNDILYSQLSPKDIYNGTKMLDIDGSILLKNDIILYISDDGFAKLPKAVSFDTPNIPKGNESYSLIEKERYIMAKECKPDKLF